jgi:hypothetical protein
MGEKEVEPSPGAVAHLGLLELNVGRVIVHLRRDLRDDWFPDVLNHSDSLTAEFICAKLEELQQDPLKGYEATKRVVRDVPKAGGALRYSLETTLVDRFVYQALVEELAGPLDALQSPHVFSHRVQFEDRKGFLKPPVPQWSLFRDAVRQNGLFSWVVEADLQNFFESINLVDLRETLLQGISKAEGNFREKARRRYAAEFLLQLLPKWCYAPTHGLPQNREASSVLANQYMRNVDEEMEMAYPKYFRYMDDIRICVESRDEARRALVTLTQSLRRIGLSLNSKKTKIYQPGSPEHSDLMAHEDKRMEDIDRMWASRSQATIVRSLSYLMDLAKELVAEEATDSKKFRFCVNRLRQLAQAEDLRVEIPRREELKKLVLAKIVEDAAVADQLCAFLRAVRLTPEECRNLELILLDKKKYLYEWQRYHIVLLLLDHEYSSPDLLDLCKQEIDAQEPDALIPRDINLVVLGKYGGKKMREEILKLYGKICQTHLEQRAGLIAVHEIPYNDGIAEYVAPNVPLAIRGMYREIRKHRGVYFMKKDKIHPSELIDVVSTYV